ncbi:hypothetical protein LSH36_16g01026 [Paralvinella palmiformis]|uniref:Uncharacterized protein n=1 Tax=Paralvinella palmiformis TaxID=53620 RepID=A0AAD9KB79_9ANNE|nr:hypothetical protein LSH36_16g01026 [Paralvinella palmiformis]
MKGGVSEERTVSISEGEAAEEGTKASNGVHGIGKEREATRSSLLFDCITDGKTRLKSGKRSKSSGSSGFTVWSLLPNVGRKINLLGRRLNLCTGALGHKCQFSAGQLNNPHNMVGKGKEKLGQPVCASSGLSVDRPYFEGKATKRERPDRRTPQLYRSQSVRVDWRPEKGPTTGSSTKSKRATSLSNVELRQQLDSKYALRQGVAGKGRRRSVSGVDNIVQQLRASSRVVEMSTELLMPNYMSSLVTDINNNDKLTSSVTRLPSDGRRSRERRGRSSGNREMDHRSGVHDLLSDNWVANPNSDADLEHAQAHREGNTAVR